MNEPLTVYLNISDLLYLPKDYEKAKLFLTNQRESVQNNKVPGNSTNIIETLAMNASLIDLLTIYYDVLKRFNSDKNICIEKIFFRTMDVDNPYFASLRRDKKKNNGLFNFKRKSQYKCTLSIESTNGHNEDVMTIGYENLKLTPATLYDFIVNIESYAGNRIFNRQARHCYNALTLKVTFS